ncbi:uncharacterized protein BDR25DRAFT_117246 [Lindgomyces ingoldianus]|uniref:Uncharacterized protein n=1 Tax=Lindgomyces ingoldianus TaxID=673940 RepID=A0ACB6Q844_9PLEO|nr:uncharacterized protein BDR25DRAFT_117246 [Lindgomyces ingoldianus]KAF2463031.1 hypothetical protein BDR25DRAFT_117246 [Lindgomyces ingoldianus]
MCDKAGVLRDGDEKNRRKSDVYPCITLCLLYNIDFAGWAPFNIRHNVTYIKLG